jgi:type II secretory pathway pseudopilin PulG
MTLIELLVAITIVALVAGGVTYGLGMVARTSLRSACMKIVAASRFAYARSVSSGQTLRVVLDLEQHQMSIEEAHGRVTLVRASDARRQEIERDAREGDESASSADPWAAAQAALSKTQRPSFGASPFSVIRDADGEPIARYQPRGLGGGIRIAKLFVPHEPEPRERGRGAIYFFPRGRTEHAVVWLGDHRDDVYAVELHPLTGRATVHPSAYEPRMLGEDEREERASEVRE